jgi:hypothetical protein
MFDLVVQRYNLTEHDSQGHRKSFSSRFSLPNVSVIALRFFPSSLPPNFIPVMCIFSLFFAFSMLISTNSLRHEILKCNQLLPAGQASASLS